mgnify:CR=1 FL=1
MIKGGKMTKEIVNEQPVETQQVQTVAQKKSERNHAIEFWRFFFSIAILGYHIGTILAPRAMAGIIEAATWMAGAGEILFVFTLTAGYFLVKHFKRLQANPEYASRTASGRAWEYLWGRIKALLPVLALGIILGVIAVAIFQESTFAVAINSVFNGLWEFLGLYAAGYPAAYSQANGAMWFISGLLICSYIIYWAMCKNEDVFAGFIAPFLFVFLGGWWAWNGTRASQAAFSTLGEQYSTNPSVTGSAVSTGVIGFNNGLLFVLIGMCGGVIIYYAVEKLKKLNYNIASKVILTIVYLAVAVLIVMFTIQPDWLAGEYVINNSVASGDVPSVVTNNWTYRTTIHLLCIVLVTLTLLGKDYVTALLNNKFTAKVLDYLGGSALYIYMLHMPFIYFYVEIRGKNPATPYSWAEVFWVVTAISVVLGCVVKYLMDKFVIKKNKTVRTEVLATSNGDTVPANVVESSVVAEEPAQVEEEEVQPKKKSTPKTVSSRTTKTAPKKTSSSAVASTKKETAKTTSKPASKSTTSKTASTPAKTTSVKKSTTKKTK